MGKRFLTTYLIVITFAGISVAQSFEKYAGEFLTLGAGSRALGMAGAVTAATSDVSAGYWNPAALPLSKGFQIEFMHSKQYISSIQHNYLGASWKINPDNAVGLTLLYLAVNHNQNSRNLFNTADNSPDYSQIRYFNTGDYGLYLSFARRYSEKLSYGINVKGLVRDYEVESALGIGFDAALHYSFTDNWTAGLMLRDITSTMMVWTTDRTELIKPSVRFGSAYLLHLNQWGISVQPSVDLQFYFENRRKSSQAYLGSVSLDTFWGIELKYNELLALRFGLDDLERFNTGIGLQLSKFAFDYAFTAYQSELGNIHRISCHLNLDDIFSN